MSRLILAHHRPSSTLLILTVSFSVAKTDRRSNLNPPTPRSVFPSQCAPCFLSCGCHRAVLPIPQDVERRAARDRHASESSSLNFPFEAPRKSVQRAATEPRGRQRTSDPLRLSPVQRRNIGTSHGLTPPSPRDPRHGLGSAVASLCIATARPAWPRRHHHLLQTAGGCI